MKKILIVPLVLGMAACGTPPQTVRTEWKVVKPNVAMYECPLLKRWPDPENLTDVQVARTLVQLYKNNVKCKNSIVAIQKFLDKAEHRVEGTPDPTEQPEQPARSKLFGLF